MTENIIATDVQRHFAEGALRRTVYSCRLTVSSTRPPRTSCGSGAP